MAAGTLDKFKKLTNNFATTLAGAIPGTTDTSMTLTTTANLPTDTGVVFVIDRVNASGVVTPLLREFVRGTVVGANVISLVRGIGNSTAQPHLSNAVVEQVVDQVTFNDVIDGILVSHDQTGALLPAAVQTALGTGNLANTGYNALGFTPATVTANGNRSYTCVFNGQNLTTTLSAGMRWRSTRTVLPQAQVSSLSGTAQYWSNATPAGMTFTNNFVAGGWYKFPAYTGVDQTLQSRYDGTNGWLLQINAAGQVKLLGLNAAAGNQSLVTSYQSVPLNKWVHIAAQLDMLSFTATPTTSYVMIDGQDCPSSVSRIGTNPTSLLQGSGAYEIGAQNGSAGLLQAKIAQSFVFSATVTQATIRTYMSQGLLGTETSLISAYSFNGTGNDLSANANNLTYNGTPLTYAADSPFSNGVAPTVTSGYDFGIIQSVSFATNTTVVVQMAEGNAIPTSGGVSAVVFSSQKAPLLFPSQRGKWRIEARYRAQISSAAMPANPGIAPIVGGQITSPSGDWRMGYNGYVATIAGTAIAYLGSTFGLSIGTSTFSVDELTMSAATSSITATETDAEVMRETEMPTLAAVTVYYLTAQLLSGSGLTVKAARSTNDSSFVIYLENSHL